jgi:PAS domain S-box-containing protein
LIALANAEAKSSAISQQISSMKISIEKKSLVGFGLATAVLVGINALSYWSLNKNRETAHWVAHTHQVRQNIEATLADIEEAEAGQRGYIITGIESYLQSYYESVTSVRQQIRDIQTLTADNPNQQQRVSLLKPLVEKRVAALWQVIDIRRSQGFDAARATIKAGQGTEMMTRIRQVLREMENEETSLLKQRVSQQQAATRTQNIVFSAGIVFNVVVFYWLYCAINREIQRRSQEQATVQKLNEQLEQKVAERTAALEGKIIALEQTKAALKDSYNLLRSVIDASPHPIFVKDLQGRYQLMNSSGARRFNKQPEEVIGLNASALFSPEVCAKFQADEQRVITTGVAETLEETIFINSEWRTYLTTRNIYCNSEGKVQGIVGFARDITALKQTQEALRIALAQEKELSQMKSRIITTISHEYRTPLTTIYSSAELLENYRYKWDDAKQIQHFQRIQSNVKHMTALVNDVLFLNQAEFEKLSCHNAPLNLVAFLKELINEQQATIGNKHRLDFTSVGSESQFLGDAKLLRQILTNLINNAIKYSPGGGTVSVHLTLEETQVILSCLDEGIGIPVEDQQELFKPFIRASNVGTIGGTGLGLSIVKKCVELHSGQITVDSVVGQGTKFTVTLPRKHCC